MLACTSTVLFGLVSSFTRMINPVSCIYPSALLPNCLFKTMLTLPIPGESKLDLQYSLCGLLGNLNSRSLCCQAISSHLLPAYLNSFSLSAVWGFWVLSHCSNITSQFCFSSFFHSQQSDISWCPHLEIRLGDYFTSGIPFHKEFILL